MVCGMDVSKNPHTRCVVKTADGKQYMTCGVQCALTLQIRFGDKWESTKARDLLSNKSFDIREGFFVYSSTVITDMAPGFIAFRRKENALNFAKGFGGQVVSYEQALEIWEKQLR